MIAAMVKYLKHVIPKTHINLQSMAMPSPITDQIIEEYEELLAREPPVIDIPTVPIKPYEFFRREVSVSVESDLQKVRDTFEEKFAKIASKFKEDNTGYNVAHAEYEKKRSKYCERLSWEREMQYYNKYMIYNDNSHILYLNLVAIKCPNEYCYSDDIGMHCTLITGNVAHQLLNTEKAQLHGYVLRLNTMEFIFEQVVK